MTAIRSKDILDKQTVSELDAPLPALLGLASGGATSIGLSGAAGLVYSGQNAKGPAALREVGHGLVRVGDGWCFCCDGFAGHVKLTFGRGTSFTPGCR